MKQTKYEVEDIKASLVAYSLWISRSDDENEPEEYRISKPKLFDILRRQGAIADYDDVLDEFMVEYTKDDHDRHGEHIQSTHYKIHSCDTILDIIDCVPILERELDNERTWTYLRKVTLLDQAFESMGQAFMPNN